MGDDDPEHLLIVLAAQVAGKVLEVPGDSQTDRSIRPGLDC